MTELPQLQPGQTRMQQVEQLQAEIERLRAALKPFAEAARRFAPYPADMDALKTEVTFTLAQLRAAYDAVEQKASK